MRKILGLAAVACLAFGCQIANSIDRSVDCNDICNRYASCYDSSYNVAACRQRCEAQATSDGGRSTAPTECDTCLDTHACVESVFSCADECYPIIP
jgi:hypothetical protein